MKYKSLIVCCLTVAFMAGILRCCTMVVAPQITAEDFRIYVTPEMSTEEVTDNIQSHEPKGSLKGLKWLFKIKKSDSIKAGSYIIRKGARPIALQRMLCSGTQSPLNVVINSHRTIEKMASVISNQLMTDSASIQKFLTDSASLASVGFTPSTVYELIIPNTYEFYWSVSTEAFMQRMAKEQEKFWNSRARKVAETGMSPHEIMTLASIVEEETSHSEEMPVVAGLYINRLKKGMLLQADPTVIFALGGERPKRVLLSHLNTDSPYNTYKYPGLPPAPIRFVSITAIDAVLNYRKHNYLYMCAKEDFSGYHNFASSLAEHNTNARRYQQAINRTGI